jgi:hypothetical protein
MSTEKTNQFKAGQIVRKVVTRFMPGNAFTGSLDREFQVTLVGRVTDSGKWISLSKHSIPHAHGAKRVPVTEDGWC